MCVIIINIRGFTARGLNEYICLQFGKQNQQSLPENITGICNQ